MSSLEKGSVKMTQAVVDVEFCVAKGEVEMKSWNVDVKRAERVKSRIGAFSVLALMILMLSTGNLLAKDETEDSYQLWKLASTDGKPAATLKHATEDEAGKAVKWLVSEPTQENFNKFVSTYQAEPFKFVEGFKAAYLKSFEDGNNVDFKARVTELLKSVDEKAWGNKFREEALKQILAALMDKSKSDLEKDELLKSLFADPITRVALGVTDTDPNKTAVKTPVIDDETKKLLDEMKKQADADRKANEERLKAIQDLVTKNQQPPAGPTPRNGTGEVNDSALKFQAQQICDKVNAIRKASEDAFKGLKDQLNASFDGLAALSRQDHSNAKKDDKNQFEDIFLPAIQDALKKDNQVAQAPTPQAQPQRAARNDRDNSNNPSPFSPVPDKPEEPTAAPYTPQPYQSTLQATAPRLSLPSNGRKELDNADDRADYNEFGRTSEIANLTPTSRIEDLVKAKVKVQKDQQLTQVDLQAAKNKYKRLNDQVEQLKERSESAPHEASGCKNTAGELSNRGR